MRVLALTYMVIGLAAVTEAQMLPLSDIERADAARFRFGVVAVEPRVGLNNFGWDSNVFNEVQQGKRDFTATLTPGADLWIRTGRGLFTVNGTADVVYFGRYGSQRSVNSRAVGQYEYGLNRLRPYLSARTLKTRDQPGFEIEARVRHYETEIQSGVDVRIGPKTNVRVNAKQIDYT